MPGKQEKHQNRSSCNMRSWLQERGTAGNPKTDAKRQGVRRANTHRAFPNRSSYSKIYRRKEREREPLRNTIQKSRGHFSADWVFLSPPRAVSGAQHPVLYPSAVAARKGAGTSTKHQHAAHSQLSQGSKLQVTSLSTGRTSPSRQNGEELLYFSCYETSGCQSCLEKGCVSAS